MNKDKIVQQITEILDLQEKSIHHHPSNVVEVYIKARDNFIEGQRSTKEKDLFNKMPFTQEEFFLIQRYVLSSSFISTWYHLAGEKTNRDKAAHSCASLVSNFGIDPELVMIKYIEYERLWRETFKNEGISPRSKILYWFFIIIIIIFIILCWFLIK